MSNPTDKSLIEDEIDRVTNKLSGLDPESEDYAAAVDQLSKLHKLKMDDLNASVEWTVKAHEMEQESRPKRVSPDTLVLAGANILGIAMIVGHERAHIVTSKAIGFIKTLR